MRLYELLNKYSVDKIRWGIVRAKNLSDELDSATVVLPQISSIDISAYDIVCIENEDGDDEYWVVADYTKTYATLQSPFLFDYILDLMSLTKWLETITLPSMTITNIGQNRTIKSYIQRVVNKYVAPRLAKYMSDGAQFVLDNRFNNVCPEMTFSQPTAREFLDWMAYNYGCIIKLDYSGSTTFFITTVDLNQSSGAMPTDYILSLVEEQSAQEYVTELDHDMNDVIAQYSITEYCRLKGSESIFTSNDSVAVLQYKPYEIKKVVVKSQLTIHQDIDIHDGGTPSTITHTYSVSDIDITDYVKVDGLWNALSYPSNFQQDVTLAYASSSATAEDAGVNVVYKTNTIKWTRGSQIVENFHLTTNFERIFGSSTTRPAIEQAIIYAWLKDNWINRMDSDDYDCLETYYITDYDWSNVIFEVEYIPYINPRLLLEQKDAYEHLVTMADNSTNATTELGKYMNYSSEKNSKLGNKNKVFTARSLVSDSYAPKYRVGQYWYDENNDRYVITTLETTTKLNSISYKGTLTKNYVNRNLVTTINREKRYFSLPDASSIVTRKEITKEYIEVALVSTQDGTELDPLDFTVTPRYVTFKTYTQSENTLLGWTFLGGVIPTKIVGGNVICYVVEFKDNTTVGDNVNYTVDNGGYKMVPQKYVDSNGELIRIKYQFHKLNPSYTDLTDEDISSMSRFTTALLSSNLVQFKDEYTINLLKDARERISWNLEEIFFSNNDKVRLGVGFAELFTNTSEEIIINLYPNDSDTYGNIMTYTGFTKLDFINGTWRNSFTSIEGTLTVTTTDGNTLLNIGDFSLNYYIEFYKQTERG